MTLRQKNFAMEYMLDGNGTKAAMRAGYSQKGANRMSSYNLKNQEVQQMVGEIMEQVQSEKVATIQEVLEYVSSVMRGDSESEVMVMEGTGSGTSQAVMKRKTPDERERMKAAELLMKLYTVGSETSVSVNIPIIIKEDLGE